MSSPAATALNAPMFRAASLRQVLAQQLKQQCVGAWQSLESLARARAAAHLQQTAQRYAGSRPELAAELGRMAREAQA